MDHSKLYRFWHMIEFLNKWKALGLTELDLNDLEQTILADPMRPGAMTGTGGLRKVRFATRTGGRGKSGAFRVCYFFFRPPGQVVTVHVFGKGEKENLSAAEKNQIRTLAAEIERISKGNES